MSESTLIQLKTIVERAVRPVQASSFRKRKMREELLAHVTGVFDEESGKAGEEQNALGRTALRFGNPHEVTRQLQESVPAGDGIMRLLEGRPGGSMLRGALLFAWIEVGIFFAVLGIALLLAGWKSPWTREEIVTLNFSFGFLPFWLFMPVWLCSVVMATHWMERWLCSSEPLAGWPRIGLVKLLTAAWVVPAVRIAITVGSLCLVLLASVRGLHWPTHSTDWSHFTVLTVALAANIMAATSIICAWFLVQTVNERRRLEEEWSRLPIEPFAQT